MPRQVFIISDLHLGGSPGFQMCNPAGQARLAAYVRWVTAQHRTERPAHLVLAGDIVDFLAEEPGAPFTVDEQLATRKLESVMASTRPVWDALRGHLASGAPLTVQLGNHDIELSLPAPRRALLERLGPGRLELLYDGEALRLGELLVEHGNRYDDWNWVNHDELLHLRRELSRGAPAAELAFEPVPGSRFVIDVMNPIKRQFAFVDLLKPEDASVVPFVALLRPSIRDNLRTIRQFIGRYLAMRRKAEPLTVGGARGPGDAREPDGEAPDAHTEAMLRLAEQITADADTWLAADTADKAGEWSTLSLLLASRSRDWRVYLGKLLAALRARSGDAAQAFDVRLEQHVYTDAARRAAERGFKVVVFGHTHLVKHVTDGLGGATYLNSGTWADLIRIPTAILREETPTEDALRELEAFAADLQDNERVQRWRRQLPTFAGVALDDDLAVTDAGVYLFRDGASLADMRIPQDTADIFDLLPATA